MICMITTLYALIKCTTQYATRQVEIISVA